ncbi:hypothetical protein V6N13_082393 [Hibiscus sabdariffa]
MADYGVAISLSQAHTSDDDSSEHSPRSVPTLSACGGGGSKSKTPCNKIITLDHLHRTPSSSDNTARKPRGRPPGSKNKPKPPTVITRDSNSTMKPLIFEISAGSDIIDSIICFARANGVGVCIISATGSVSNVTLCHPVSHAPAFALHGPFGLLSLSGSFIASGSLSSSSPTPPPSPCSLFSSGSFSVTLAGAQGQVFGGIIGGKVMAASQVIVVAATFINPELHVLPCEDDDKDHHQETKPGAATESVYAVASPTPINCQIPPDVMPWGFLSCRQILTWRMVEVMAMASDIGFRLLVQQKQTEMSVFEAFIVRGRTSPREVHYLAIFSYMSSRGAAGRSLLCYDLACHSKFVTDVVPSGSNIILVSFAC